MKQVGRQATSSVRLALPQNSAPRGVGYEVRQTSETNELSDDRRWIKLSACWRVGSDGMEVLDGFTKVPLAGREEPAAREWTTLLNDP